MKHVWTPICLPSSLSSRVSDSRSPSKTHLRSWPATTDHSSERGMKTKHRQSAGALSSSLPLSLSERVTSSLPPTHTHTLSLTHTHTHLPHSTQPSLRHTQPLRGASAAKAQVYICRVFLKDLISLTLSDWVLHAANQTGLSQLSAFLCIYIYIYTKYFRSVGWDSVATDQTMRRNSSDNRPSFCRIATLMFPEIKIFPSMALW